MRTDLFMLINAKKNPNHSTQTDKHPNQSPAQPGPSTTFPLAHPPIAASSCSSFPRKATVNSAGSLETAVAAERQRHDRAGLRRVAGASFHVCCAPMPTHANSAGLLFPLSMPPEKKTTKENTVPWRGLRVGLQLVRETLFLFQN